MRAFVQDRALRQALAVVLCESETVTLSSRGTAYVPGGVLSEFQRSARPGSTSGSSTELFLLFPEELIWV